MGRSDVRYCGLLPERPEQLPRESHVPARCGAQGAAKGTNHSQDTYSCTCMTNRGWVGNGKTCADQNACQSQGSVCGKKQIGDVDTGKG